MKQFLIILVITVIAVVCFKLSAQNVEQSGNFRITKNYELYIHPPTSDKPVLYIQGKDTVINDTTEAIRILIQNVVANARQMQTMDSLLKKCEQKLAKTNQ